MDEWVLVISLRHNTSNFLYRYEVNLRTGEYRTNFDKESDIWTPLQIKHVKSWINEDLIKCTIDVPNE